jgi:hypothetical protein
MLNYGTPHPDAPRELRQFAFLIGTWRCESTVTQSDGSTRTFPATWVGRYILDGWVIEDEFRQFGPAGEVVQLGRNYRCYNRDRRAWSMKWLDAVDGAWLDLAPEDLGGVAVAPGSITFQHRRPSGRMSRLFPAHSLFRVTFSDLTDDHFSWRAELSADGGETWAVVQVIDAHRAEPDA